MYIIKVLRRLALPAIQQKEYLFDLGTAPSADELALEFDDAYLLFTNNIENRGNGIDDRIVLEKIKEINSILNQMSNLDDPDIWNVKSLNNTWWNKIRLLASEVLHRINMYNLDN